MQDDGHRVGNSRTFRSLCCRQRWRHRSIFVAGTQYQVLDVVGEGAYGIVCSAVHRPSGRKVAIKKIAPFDHSMFCLRTLRELKLLKFLSEAGVCENVRPSLCLCCSCFGCVDKNRSDRLSLNLSRSSPSWTLSSLHQ